MKESKLREIHRYLGVCLAILLTLQGITGLLLTFEHLFKPTLQGDHTAYGGELVEKGHKSHLFRLVETIHTEGGTIGGLYRGVVGLGLLAMVGSGLRIYLFVRSRRIKTKKREKEAKNG